MSELTFTQTWFYNAGSDPVDPVAELHLRCNGVDEHHLFVGAAPEPYVLEVQDGSFCYIEHTIKSSDVETEASCDPFITVSQDTQCDYDSAVFDVSVPALNLWGSGLLIVLLATVATVAIRRFV